MASAPTAHDTAHLINLKEKHRYQSFKFKQYADFAQTIFIAATIASTIALSKAYEASSKSTLGEDGIILAWASSLLVTSIAGSVILVASAKLELAFYLLQIQSLVVSLLVLVAFYLLLATPSFRQQYTGPFLFATVCYWIVVVLLVCLIIDVLVQYFSGRGDGLDWWGVHWRRKSLIMGVYRGDQDM